MRIGRVEAMQHDFARVGAIVAVGVLEEHQVRLLCDVRPAVPKFQTCRNVQTVGKDRLLVGLAVAVSVLVDQQLVIDRRAGQVHRVAGHRDDPQPAAAVELELHRLLQIGKIYFRGEQIDLVTVGQLNCDFSSSGFVRLIGCV